VILYEPLINDKKERESSEISFYGNNQEIGKDKISFLGNPSTNYPEGEGNGRVIVIPTVALI